MPPTIRSIGCRRNRNRAATPKLPPPPRIAQNRSGCDPRSTRRISPFAVTMSAASRLSMARPCLRTRYPTPPLSVMLPSPTEAGASETRREAVGAGRDAVLARPSTRCRPRPRASCGIDLERAQVTEVDHDAAVADAVTDRAVPAAADGELEVALTREGDHARDVPRIGDAGDHRRPAVHAAGEDRTRAVVVGVAGSDDPAVDLGEERHCHRGSRRDVPPAAAASGR